MKPRAKLPKNTGPSKSAKQPKQTQRKPSSPVPPAELPEDEQQHDQATQQEEVPPNGETSGEKEETEQLEDGGAQSRSRMLQRHKQELRDLKKVRGKSKQEVKKMEHELRARQQAELHAFDREQAALRPKTLSPKPAPAPTTSDSSDNDHDSDDEGEGDADQESRKQAAAGQPSTQAASKKPSRAARRKQKREAEDRAREKRIEEERKNAGPSAKALEIRRLMEKLQPQGFRIAEVAADGNCLYSAVGDQVKRLALSGPQTIAGLRRMAAEYIQAHPDDFLPFLIADDDLPPEGLGKYCEELKRDGVWGGQLELRALAQSLKVPIVVHSADAPELKMGDEFVGSAAALQLSFHRHYYALGEHYNSVVAEVEVPQED